MAKESKPGFLKDSMDILRKSLNLTGSTEFVPGPQPNLFTNRAAGAAGAPGAAGTAGAAGAPGAAASAQSPKGGT